MKVNVELSLDERMSRVYDAWNSKFAGPDGMMSVYVREVFDEFVIARAEGQGGLWAYPYTVNEAEAIGFGQPFEVVIAYQDKESGVQVNNWLSKIAEKLGIKSNESEVTVNEKEKLIAALVANTRCKFAKDALEKFNEGQLQTLSDSLAEPTPAPEPAPPAPEPIPAPAPVPVPAADVTTLTQMVSELTKTVQELSGKIQTNASQERAELIAYLIANQTTFTAEDIGKLDTPFLQKMRLQFTPADYGLRGLPIVNVGGGGDWVEYEIVTPSPNGGAN